MRIALSDQVRYPDMSVVTGAIAADVKTPQDALVLFEVQSDETLSTHLVAKRDEYLLLGSLCLYGRMEQDRMGLTVLQRAQDGWRESQLVKGNLGLPDVGPSVPIGDICRRVGRRESRGPAGFVGQAFRE